MQNTKRQNAQGIKFRKISGSWTNVRLRDERL